MASYVVYNTAMVGYIREIAVLLREWKSDKSDWHQQQVMRRQVTVLACSVERRSVYLPRGDTNIAALFSPVVVECMIDNNGS